ncbi:P83/100 family protein [Leadbettera azotonutricia]|uniref:P83/100 family protein n=1 Tax=Leadbettera azotonutricia TaxID=150829 RepID=UPI0002D8E790|nr:P83/100 family protein [Leadbettera azotonutricia]
MKKSLRPISSLYILILLGVLAAPLAFGQVNRDELSDLGPVEFINYEGPYSRIETRAQIKAIGYSLGVMIRTGQTRAGGTGRYFVIHSVSPADGFKLDADVFGLGVDIGVDHVRNLRLIIQGYLEAAYSYTEKDAALLAEYITIYNAVYRGDLKYFSSRYKAPVMDNVTQDKAGLSIRYDEWPGRTLMLIPLGMGSAGPLSNIDTTPLTDSKVTEQLRQEPDKSLDTRKDMVDLKERQSDQASQQAAIQKDAIKEEEQKQAQQQQEARQQQQEAQQKQQQAAQEKEQVAQERQNPNADQKALDQKQQEAEQKEQEARRQQQEAEQKEQEARQKQQELEKQKQEADQTQQYADQKADEAQQDRQGIAQDQQSLINQQPVPPPAEGVLGVTILTPNASLGRIVKLNPDNGQEVLRSGLNTANARSVTLADGKIIAIAGENRGNGAIRLIQINADTLEMIKQGDDDISPNSLIWANGADLYAITSSGGNLYLARFNSDLARQARSSVTIHPFASVIISGSSLITQRADGTALLLNPKDLSEKR